MLTMRKAMTNRELLSWMKARGHEAPSARLTVTSKRGTVVNAEYYANSCDTYRLRIVQAVRAAALRLSHEGFGVQIIVLLDAVRAAIVVEVDGKLCRFEADGPDEATALVRVVERYEQRWPFNTQELLASHTVAVPLAVLEDVRVADLVARKIITVHGNDDTRLAAVLETPMAEDVRCLALQDAEAFRSMVED